MEPTIPLFWSTISMNWPITNGTDWIRLTSSCALRSSRFRFFCSSLMYSSCMSTNSSCRCNSFCRVYRSSSSISVPAITLVSGRNVFSDITGAIPEDITPDISISESISPSLSVTYGTFSVSLSVSVFLVLDLLAQFRANSEKFHTNLAAKSHNSRNNKQARKRAHHRARK